jgi:hypothetical protein
VLDEVLSVLVVIDEVLSVLVVLDKVLSVLVVLDKMVEPVTEFMVEVVRGLEIVRAMINAAIAVASSRIASTDKSRHIGEHWQQ